MPSTTTGPIERDVEALLMRTRKCRRKSGEVPYPLEYTRSMISLDNLDQLFLVKCCRGLTMHQFKTPPRIVLDLGCGAGFWAMEAAKQWSSSIIIGFDIKDIQPRLSTWARELSRRIKWVHGNLLDGLPFPPDYFDFVRLAGIGLGVPEDEWQFVLEEVSRVMRPGGVIEIIEEDPIFPTSRPPPPPPPAKRPRLPPITINVPLMSEYLPSSAYTARSSSTLLSDPWSTTAPDDHSEFSATKSISSSSSSDPSLRSMKSSSLLKSPGSTYSTPDLHSTRSRSPTTDSDDLLPHPQDHTRLEAAWEAMLSRRFLCPNLLSVLPFYISSSFVDVQTRPPLKIPLPPNSIPGQPSSHGTTPRASNQITPDIVAFLDSESSPSQKPAAGDVPPNNTRIMPPETSMHLAKTVQTVAGCKEAIWTEYEKLYSEDVLPFVTRTTRPEAVQAQSTKPSSREAFEADWTNWELDMTDRINMRGRIGTQLSMAEPPGEPPDWQKWRGKVEKYHKTSIDSVYSSTTDDDPQLCRSLGGFVGWKP